LAFTLILPLPFGSNVFVATAQLPGWLQAWVKVNPVTQVSDAVRGLLLDLPLGRTITTSLLWTASILWCSRRWRYAPTADRPDPRNPRAAWLQQPSKRAEQINRP
jgi:hypothetical protein